MPATAPSACASARAKASPSFWKTPTWVEPDSAISLPQPDFEANPVVDPDFLLAERDIREELLKLSSRIGPLEQHEPKCGDGHATLDRAKPHAGEVLSDVGHRHVPVQVDDQRPATGAQHAIHLLERLVWL